MGKLKEQYLNDAERANGVYIKENLRLQDEVENLREQERWLVSLCAEQEKSLVRRIRELEWSQKNFKEYEAKLFEAGEKVRELEADINAIRKICNPDATDITSKYSRSN